MAYNLITNLQENQRVALISKRANNVTIACNYLIHLFIVARRTIVASAHILISKCLCVLHDPEYPARNFITLARDGWSLRAAPFVRCGRYNFSASVWG